MKKLRGDDLNRRIDEILAKMLSEGYAVAPISRSAVQKKLGLKSRSTLIREDRADLIENARVMQLERAGLDTDGKRRRKNAEERIDLLLSEIAKLEKERDHMNEKLASIVNYLTMRGLDAEEAMKILRPSFRNHKT